jgi:N6-adenosine-specific RNA methylase IME4
MKKYKIIYADPAWAYGDKQNTKLLGGAIKHYPTMSTKDICLLNVKNIIEKDAVLFLWVTSPLLTDGLEVIKSWGFKYKTSFIWDKIKHNMGHYNSVRHEFLLVATKGSCTPEVKKLFDSVVSEERTVHSRKPQIFRDIINTIYPSGNRIELFARQKVDSWDSWGNEVSCDIEL